LSGLRFAVTRLALRDCREGQLTLNVAYQSLGRDWCRQICSHQLHRIPFTCSAGPALNAGEKKSFWKPRELSYIGAEQHTDRKAPTQEHGSAQAP